MDIRHIEYFTMLAKTEHVSRTAEHFNISQPSLSKSISLLEFEVGSKLFDRTGNRIRLNENGRIYLAYVEKALDLMTTGSLAAAGNNKKTGNELIIEYNTYPSILSGPLNLYMRDHPDLTVSRFGSDNRDRPYLSIYSLPEGAPMITDELWVNTFLFRENHLLIASPEYGDLPVKDGYADITALRNERFVAFSTSDNLLIKDITHEICMDAGFYPIVNVNTGDFMQKMHAIDGGCSIGIIPECCLDDAVRLSPGLRIYRIDESRYSRSVYARYRSVWTGERTINDFLDFLREYYKEER